MCEAYQNMYTATVRMPTGALRDIYFTATSFKDAQEVADAAIHSGQLVVDAQIVNVFPAELSDQEVQAFQSASQIIRRLNHD